MAIISRSIWRIRESERTIMGRAARMDAPGRFVRLRHGLTHCQLDDDPERPLLICIHGWSTASYVWEPLRPHLRAMGYRLLTYDLYGRGYSDRPDTAHTAELFTTQLNELLDGLRLRQRPFSVLGYSMGGAIAASFVSRCLEDVERMLLIAPAGMAVRMPGLRAFARATSALSDPHVMALLPAVLRAQFRSAPEAFPDDPSVARVARLQERELDYRGYVPSLLSSLNGVLSTRMEAEHRRIARSDVIVRAIFADADTTIPFPKARTTFEAWHSPDASDVVEGADHAVTYTHPHDVISKFAGYV